MAIKGVGQNFRYLRVVLGIPQQEVAKQAGLSQRCVRKFELENTDIRLGNLVALCDAISMPVTTVLYGRYYDEMQTIDNIVKKFHDNANYRKRVGNLMKQERKGRGFTQNDLAMVVGVTSSQNISHIECGKYSAALSNISLFHICKVLNISYCEFEES